MKFKKLKVKYFDTIFYIIATIAIGYFLFITVDKKEIGLSRIELLEGNFESIYENKATKRSGASYDIDIQDNEDILKILPNYFKCFKFQEFILEVKPNDKITLLIDDDENFIWAGTFMAHEVYQKEDGTLGVRIPETVWNAFDKEEKKDDFVINTPTKSSEVVVGRNTGDIFKFEADVEFSEGTRTFGVRFYEDEDKAESYQFVFNTTENRYVFEKKPNWPWPANQNIGLERPLDLIPGKKYNIRMIVDDTIATIYVDGVALNARAYKRPGESLSLFASEGSLKVTNCKVTTGLKK